MHASENDPQLEFFDAASKLCGEKFEGEMTFPTEGQDSFAGKLLVASIEACTEEEIRIPFHVGSDHSRTWIISKTQDGLQLKHDHRHEDGTPDEINMYGGLAGDHTATIIPDAKTNVWTMTLSEDTNAFTYHLERHNAPRFTAELTKSIHLN